MVSVSVPSLPALATTSTPRADSSSSAACGRAQGRHNRSAAFVQVTSGVPGELTLRGAASYMLGRYDI